MRNLRENEIKNMNEEKNVVFSCFCVFVCKAMSGDGEGEGLISFDDFINCGKK